MTDLVIKNELKGIEESKAKQIEAVFHHMVVMLKEFEGKYEEVISLEQSPEKCAKAKRLRLDVAKIRIEADKVRKEQKEEYLRAGNAIQGVYNILKFAVTKKEEKLKEIETFYERIEEEKRQKLIAERTEELSVFDFDTTGIDLGGMEEDVYDRFKAGIKANYEAVKEAEHKAEQERIEREAAEKAEQERIRQENERLRQEAEAREKELEAAREKEAARIKAEKEEAARIAEEERKKASAPDREKLITLASTVLGVTETLSSSSAKNAVKQAYEILTKAAREL